ncbi:hypothetical protein GLOTRDRAFT_67792 [Gloeophyllum trabeum ATCC 11539]|uniref:Histone deacetylase interacting domain-containing protein n=1 Tax=Gloeophyllum trabeum (strain ATCC 11539 / FP-39264 / Madison 617) TaxID=670483 RepID=S7QKK3_GLOTA|nr:uncharacterized protein GLOTRDRAFT_67792 [Gloeophyllum trabeum ATCC 11539]EPQ60306.1 hypothetical protein GLOTRDRAFT_67792 [Gloeophyllum trabeum ATCC 11539]
MRDPAANASRASSTSSAANPPPPALALPPEETKPSTLTPKQSAASARPLNVTDALSYLDAVKAQFQDQPDVYNKFLDIMKDFKSEILDTPGVIQRVSMLFQGNPQLIQGFNTFLPPGYRIDCSADPRDTNITVTTPEGVVTQSTQGLPAHFQPATPPLYSPGIPGASTTAAANFLGGYAMNPAGGAPQGQESAQFRNAIEYLHKIKSRFADDTEVYKQFLEILQSHQKENGAQQSQVYAQVHMLFKDAPDLFEGFKDFLPDAQGLSALGAQAILPQPEGGEKEKPGTDKENQKGAGAEKKAAAKRRKRPAPAEKEPTPVGGKGGSRAKRPKTQHKPEPASPPYSPYQRPATPPHVHAQQQQAHQRDHRNHASSSQPPQHPPPPPAGMQQPPVAYHQHVPGHLTPSALDAVTFFDQAKALLEQRGMYGDFLKLLDMFGHDMIDARVLIEKAEPFIGESAAGTGDLMRRFKEFVGFDEKEGNVEMGPPGSIRTGPPDLSVPRGNDVENSPSYRRLPESERRLACSARDQLGRSVLNDDWVSHPTWASEDSGFIAHKKNTNEDCLHKSEEERHEYRVHLEAMARTIAILEPLNMRIDEMSNDERAVFKLKPDLGGYSKALYQRTIRKVYGNAGAEIYQALQDCPSVAVPVVLARLKRKEEEWKKMEREWSRTWRDLDAKNFYKSLDYQAIIFKQNDKKNITAKHFVQDIEAVKAEQAKARGDDPHLSFTRGSLGFQLEYPLEDTGILYDVLKMVDHFLERSQTQYSMQERRRLERFLRSFIPLLLMQPYSELTPEWVSVELGPDDEDDAVDGSKGGRRSASGRQTGGVAAGDLRSKLLKTARERRTASAPNSRSTSPGLSRDERELQAGFAPETDDIWIQESASSLPEGVPRAGLTPAKRRPFFANTTFYTLLRLVQLLYSRLLLCKGIGAKLAAVDHEPLRPNPIAVELGLEEPNGPASVLERAIQTLSEGPGTNVLYKYLLESCEKVFDNEMDQQTFEEHARWFFGTQAYTLFTIDKLILALIKQVHTIVTDNKCQELWFLLQKARRLETPTTHDIIRYRREAERHVGSDDNLYRIEWDRLGKTMRIQLVGPDDASVDEGTSPSERWREYVDTFIMRHRTEWMPLARSRKRSSPVFMKRCLPPDDTPATDSCLVQNKMAIRISLGTYKIFYEAGTEDFIWQRRSAADDKLLRERAAARHEERKQCRLLQ